jgi:hypothetical protein
LLTCSLVHSCRSSTKWINGSRGLRNLPLRSGRCRPRLPRFVILPICATFPFKLVRPTSVSIYLFLALPFALLNNLILLLFLLLQ